MARAPSIRTDSTVPSTLPTTGRVVAVIIGIEIYQRRATGGLPPVQYARRDVEGFEVALRSLYPASQLEIELITDNDATQGTIRYQMTQAIRSLGADDLFIFYYAGHGFHSAGGNRITAWDSHAHNPEETTLRLRDILLDPLEQTECGRALAFVDACATAFAPLVRSRDVISALDPGELADFLASARYRALFLSCQPGQKSYPSDALQHGIWTHFLLRALRGEAEDALGPGRFLTDGGLRDYLNREVPAYIRRSTEHRGIQQPQALITASNTFAIMEVAEPPADLAEAGDLSRISLSPTEEYLEGRTIGRVRDLPGFARSRGHFEPDTVNDWATNFIRSLLAWSIDEEVQEIYSSVKAAFRLRRRDIERESGDGSGNIDTDNFRFSIEVRQHGLDPAKYVISRKLVLRENPHDNLALLDEAFGSLFQRLVVKVGRDALVYDDLVDAFEDIEAQVGGSLTEEQHLERVNYRAPDGTELCFDVAKGRVSLSIGGRQVPSDLIARARAYRFDLTGPSLLLIP